MGTEEKQGIIFVIIAYVLWGFMPIYWKLLEHVSSDEILTGRVIWSFIFTLMIVIVCRDLKRLKIDLKDLWANQKSFWGLFLASYLVTGNWFTYIFAVNAGYIVQTSLGYYINPLISIMLGIVFLKERLSRAQQLSVLLAAIGVIILTVSYGGFPWIAFTLAITFALYGLIKKSIKIDAIRGLTIETFFVLPVALIYFVYLLFTDKAVFFTSNTLTVTLIIFTGVATAVPLILFAKGTKTMPLYMSGFFQYIAPTIMLLVGVLLYDEAFSKIEFLSFSCIWLALILFTVSKVLEVRKAQALYKKG